MKCPHCSIAFHDSWQQAPIGEVSIQQSNNKYRWVTLWQICPACKKEILTLQKSELFQNGGFFRLRESFLAYPKTGGRPLPQEVPDPYRRDFAEACLVFPDSPKASAAISRRCLQALLRDEAKVKPSDLSKEIDEVLSAGKLPSHLAEAIDGVRNIGNFAAHPLKSQNSGAIIEVEPGEADWLLDTLEGLFDFYFVQPAILQKKRAALNQKLSEAGKPPMK